MSSSGRRRLTSITPARGLRGFVNRRPPTVVSPPPPGAPARSGGCHRLHAPPLRHRGGCVGRYRPPTPPAPPGCRGRSSPSRLICRRSPPPPPRGPPPPSTQ